MIPKLILVPTDFSETAEHGVRYAFELAGKLGARMHLLHAHTIPIPPIGGSSVSAYFEEAEEVATRAIQASAQKYREHAALEGSTVTTGDPSEAIIAVAAKIGADLIVIGTHGRRGVQRMLLGSVAETVLRRASCPVLAIRLPDNP